jgi:hypothetical protein
LNKPAVEFGPPWLLAESFLPFFQLIIESDSGETEVVREVAKLERSSLRPDDLGLTLSEAKALAGLVSRRNAAQGNGSNGQGVGE